MLILFNAIILCEVYFFKTIQNEELSTPYRVAIARQKWEARTANQNVSSLKNGMR